MLGGGRQKPPGQEVRQGLVGGFCWSQVLKERSAVVPGVPKPEGQQGGAVQAWCWFKLQETELVGLARAGPGNPDGKSSHLFSRPSSWT